MRGSPQGHEMVHYGALGPSSLAHPYSRFSLHRFALHNGRLRNIPGRRWREVVLIPLGVDGDQRISQR
jgi:hypothetical protein